jgi:hypothetical protein
VALRPSSTTSLAFWRALGLVSAQTLRCLVLSAFSAVHCIRPRPLLSTCFLSIDNHLVFDVLPCMEPLAHSDHLPSFLTFPHPNPPLPVATCSYLKQSLRAQLPTLQVVSECCFGLGECLNCIKIIGVFAGVNNK